MVMNGENWLGQLIQKNIITKENEMALRSFEDVTRHVGGLKSRGVHRKALKEETYDGDILDATVVTLSSDVPAGEREVSINQFYQDIRSINSQGSNLILTAISF
jgi:trehalose-6-phosphate synthase